MLMNMRTVPQHDTSDVFIDFSKYSLPSGKIQPPFKGNKLSALLIIDGIAVIT